MDSNVNTSIFPLVLMVGIIVNVVQQPHSFVAWFIAIVFGVWFFVTPYTTNH